MSPEPGHRALDELFETVKPVLTPEKVADLLDYESTQAVHKLLREGRLRGYKTGGRWIILRDDLKNWIKAGTNIHPDLEKE